MLFEETELANMMCNVNDYVFSFTICRSSDSTRRAPPLNVCFFARHRAAPARAPWSVPSRLANSNQLQGPSQTLHRYLNWCSSAIWSDPLSQLAFLKLSARAQTCPPLRGDVNIRAGVCKDAPTLISLYPNLQSRPPDCIAAQRQSSVKRSAESDAPLNAQSRRRISVPWH